MMLKKYRLLTSVCAAVFALTLGNASYAEQQAGAVIHNGNYAQLKTYETALANAGLTVRLDIRWSDIETKQGVLAMPGGYGSLDALVTHAHERGANVIIVLCYGNKFYDNGGFIKSPQGLEAYAKYVKFVVNHFKGRATQFEVWNEWNLDTGPVLNPGLKKSWGEASDYVNLLRTAQTAIKQENPEAVVVGGAVGGTDGNWIEKFIKAGGLSYLDAFSVHPYVYHHSHKFDKREFVWPTYITKDEAREAAAAIPGTPEDAMAWIDELKTRIDAGAPGKNIPIFISEFGTPTDGNPDSVTEPIAAAYMQRFMLMAHTRSWISSLWFYELMDGPGGANDDEAHFGMLHGDATPKDAYNAYLQIKDIMQSPTLAKQETGSKGEILIRGEFANHQKFVAAWLPTNDFSHAESSDLIQDHMRGGFRPISVINSTALSATPMILTKQNDGPTRDDGKHNELEHYNQLQKQ